MTGRSLLILGLLLAAALAGCADDDAGDAAGGDRDRTAPVRLAMPEDPMPEGAGHDHTDAAAHKFLWNYGFASRDPLMQNEANIAGVHALDLQNGYLFGAVYGSHAASVDGGLVIWDLADPANPVETGRWVIPGSVGGDRSMEATMDGDFAVIATEPVDCFGHVNPLAAVSAYLIDTSDKTLPVVADVVTPAGSVGGTAAQGPGGGSLSVHSVAVHRIQGEDYAFLFGDIYRIERSETGASLVYVNRVSTGHDIYLRETPWNTTWALAANGPGGLVIYDVTDVTAPREIATWDLPDRDNLTEEYYFHTSDVAFLDDGSILIVLTSEDWEDHVSPLWVLDGTPLRGLGPDESTNLEVLGEWHNPGNHTAVLTSFSLHNPRFSDGGILTISSYHAGLWQLDMRDPAFWSDPAEIAYAVYADGTPPVVEDPVFDTVEAQLCGLGLQMDTPTYMDVEVGSGGVLYAADVYMGLYTFTPAADHPVFGSGAP